MIDWDRLAGDAESTPRGVLVDFLAGVDDIDAVVVIAVKWDDNGSDSFKYSTSGSPYAALGLIRAAQLLLEKHVMGQAD